MIYMILSSVLKFIPTILFFLIILSSVLWGFIRGLRKSVILTINWALALLCAFVVYLIIFKGNFDSRIVDISESFGIDLKSLLGTSRNYANLSGYLNEVAIDLLPANFISSSGLLTVIATLVAIVEALIKCAVIFVLYFVYLIFLGLFYIIYLIFFKEGRYKKKADKDYKAGKREKEYKTRRGYGSLVGLGRGIVSALLVLGFIGAFFGVLTGGVYSEKESDATIVVDDKEYNIGEYVDIVNQYGTVGIGKVLESVKTSSNVPVYLLMTDYLTKGEYEIGNTQDSMYLREELGPIVGFVKETALLALEYDFDISKASSTDYLIEFMSKDNVSKSNSNVCFSDELERLVDKFNFGPYTMYLTQSLAWAIADSVNTNGEVTFTTKLMYSLFKGENRLDVKDVLNNKNIDLLLKLAIDIASNYNEVNGFISDITSTNSEPKLLFGIRKQNANSKNSSNAEVFGEVLKSIQKTIDNLGFINDGKSDKLLSELTVLIINETMPDFSLEGIDKKEDKYSIYNVKWSQGIYEIFDTLYEVVMFISDKNIADFDSLLDELFISFDKEDNIGNKTIHQFLDSDYVGALLNAKGLRSLIDNALAEQNIKMPDNIAYGAYYENGKKVQGEVDKLIAVLDDKVPLIYQMYKDKRLNVIGEWVDPEKGLLSLCQSLVDENNENYSKLLHYTLSNVFLMIEIEGFEIIVPEESVTKVGDFTLVKSSELVGVFDIINDLDIGDLKDAPANVDLQAFFVERVIKIKDKPNGANNFANCSILNATFVNFIEGVEIENEGSTYKLLIPTESLKTGINTKQLTSDEFRNILRALDVACNGNYNLTSMTNFDHMLEDEAIETIAQSMILHATLIDVMLDISAKEDSDKQLLRIPELYKQIDLVNNFSNSIWVKNNELVKLGKAIKALGISVSNMNISESEILKIAIKPHLEDSKLKRVLNSDVMHFTLSEEVSSIEGIDVPTPLYKDMFDYVSVETDKAIKKDELFNFFNAIYLIVGEEALNEGMNFAQASESITVDFIKNKGLLNYDSLEDMMASIIVETKISQIIANEEQVTIPNSYKFENINDANLYKWISIDSNGNLKDESECKNILKALDTVGLLEIIASSENEIDINKFMNMEESQVDLVLNSIISHATFVQKFFEESSKSSDIYIPKRFVHKVNGEEVSMDKALIEAEFENLQIVKQEEVRNILNSIKYFELDFNNLNVNPDIILTFNEETTLNNQVVTKLDVIYESMILWHTVTKQILKKDSEGIIDVPYETILDNRDNEFNDDYITKSEMKSLINSLDSLLIESFDQQLDSDILLKDDIDLNVALESNIIWYTVSEKLTENQDLLKPNNAYTTLGNTYNVVLKSEIISLQYVIKDVLSIDSIKALDTNKVFDKLTSGNDEMINDICQSLCLWYTISDKIINTNDLVVPNIVDEVISESRFIQKIEVASLVNSARDLGLLNTISEGGAISASVFDGKSKAVLEKVFESKSLHATVILKFFEAIEGNSSIKLPSRYQTEVTKDTLVSNLSSFNIYNDNEMINILLSVNQLNVSLENPEIEVNDILSDEINLLGPSVNAGGEPSKVHVLYNSKIIWYTVSFEILNEAQLDIPRLEVYDSRDEYFAESEYTITLVECYNMIMVAKKMGIDDITTEFNEDMLFASDITGSDIVASKIVWYTSSTKILTETEMQLPHDHIYKYVDASYKELSETYTYITEVELKDLLFGCKVLGVNSSTIISVNCIFDMGTHKASELSSSYILWLTISRKILEEPTIDVPDYLKTIEHFDVPEEEVPTQVYIDKDELDLMVEAFKQILPPTLNDTTGEYEQNVHTFQVDDYINGSYTKEEWKHLYEGDILRYTLTNRVFEAPLIIPDIVVEEKFGSALILEEELEKFMTAINVLMPENITDTDVELTKIYNSISVLVESDILLATISEKMIVGGQKVCQEDYTTAFDYKSNNTTYIIDKDEVIHFVGCAEAVGLTSYSDRITTVNASTIPALVESHILCMTYNTEINTLITVHNYTNPTNQVTQNYEDLTILSYDETQGVYVETVTNILIQSSIEEYSTKI